VNTRRPLVQDDRHDVARRLLVLPSIEDRRGGIPHAIALPLLHTAAITVMSMSMSHGAPFANLTADASASGLTRLSGLILLLRLSCP
jgi:hypothetical protein